MAFKGFPDEALAFYQGLELDNSKRYWEANRATYRDHVKAPLEAFLAELDAEFGPFHLFRPHRDVRFSPDKTPYKTHAGAVGEREGGAMYYVQLSASGLMAASGYYGMANDQLGRFRDAVLDEVTGNEIAGICAALTKKGCTIGAVSELKTAPRGIPRDHPRIALLRRKGLAAMRSWPVAPWLGTKQAVTKVRDAWRACAPLNDWLDKHVGPSELPPDDAW